MKIENLNTRIFWQSPTSKDEKAYHFSIPIEHTPDTLMQTLEELLDKAGALCWDTGLKQKIVIRIEKGEPNDEN